MREYNAQLRKEFKSGNFDNNRQILQDNEDEHSDEEDDDIDKKSDDDDFIDELKKQ